MWKFWNPFRKYKLEPKIPSEPMINISMVINPTIKSETEQYQLRSLKARTEITMTYERVAEEALNKYKGRKHAQSYS